MKNFSSPSLDDALSQWAKHNALPMHKAASIRQGILSFEAPIPEEPISEPLPLEWWREFFVDFNQQLNSATHLLAPNAIAWAARNQRTPEIIASAR